MRNRVAAVAFAALGLIAAGSTRSFALTLGPTVTSTATVTVGGTPTVNFTLDLRDVANPLVDTNPAQITWSGANAGDGWKIANQTMKINATVTDVNGGIQIYTNNKDADGSYVYNGPAGTNPAGLVSSPDGLSTLPLAWSIKAATAAVGVDFAAADPNTGPSTGIGNRFQWLFMKDRNTPDIPAENTTHFTDGESYVRLYNYQGIQAFAGSITPLPDGVDTFVYLEANFAAAGAGQTFGTNDLVVQGFSL